MAARRRPRSTACTTSDIDRPCADGKLGREADLDVADALRLVVEAELVGDPFDRLGVDHHRRGVQEALEILGQVLVGILEDQLAQAFDGVGGKLDLPLLREFDQGRDPQRSVEVDVEVGLGKPVDNVRV